MFIVCPQGCLFGIDTDKQVDVGIWFLDFRRDDCAFQSKMQLMCRFYNNENFSTTCHIRLLMSNTNNWIYYKESV